MPIEDENQGWVGQIEDVVELGERVGLWNGDGDGGTTPSGQTATPEEQKKFLERMGMGALYEPGGALYDEWIAYKQGKRDAVNGKGVNGDIAETGDGMEPMLMGAVVVGGVVLYGAAAAAVLFALWLASRQAG